MKANTKASDFLTAEQAQGLIEDVIGESLKTFEERISDSRSTVVKDLAYAIKHVDTNPRAGSFKTLPKKERKKEMSAFLGALAVVGGRDHLAASKAAKGAGFDYAAKALGTATVANGGILLQPEFADDFLELLREDSVLMGMGIRGVNMPSGVLQFGGIATGATAAYRGESAAATNSQPTTRGLELKARILDVLCAANEQFLRGEGNEEFIQEELISATQNKMDETGIRSDGTQDKPKGLLYLAASANKFNETNAASSSNGSTTAELVADLGTLMANVKGDNIAVVRPGWLFPTRVWKRLFTELDANSNPVFRAQLNQGMLFGIPFKETNHIPVNLTAAAGSGGGSDATEVYLADFWHVLLGETKAMTVKASDTASYTESGSLVSAFERGETVFKVEMEHDFAARHAEKISVLESCTWGA